METKRNSMAALGLAALVLMAVAVGTTEALSECAKLCMPVCLKEDSNMSACETACENYCDQIDGNTGGGPIFDKSLFH
ncbi:hypothetical protein CDL15_Pgr018950 [Punica granatum]|uniref:Thionin-like protein 2 n=1 Tax=Punica granatum TaxID=22663 RepID=A0A218WNF5_PUNGR|nr:hypothetical protein CDL15_Pgr018950 [Punica granatum]PKI50189.1 hypothetical protein CRG98_029433 [Punica granatum]